MITNKPILELGNIKEGSVVTGKFLITNDSSHSVNITGSRASCGCTAPSLDKGELEPGAFREVSITFNSTGKRGDNFKQVFIDYLEEGVQKTIVQNFRCNVS